MRSPKAVAAALILLLGVPLAFIVGIVFGDGAENVIHLALAATFLLLASAVFDFALPRWINLAACVATATLGAIFLAQGASDLMHSASMQHLAYTVLGQRVEKMLGDAFLLWCVALLLKDSVGKTQVFGAATLVAVLSVEIYSIVMTFAGGDVSGILKLLYLPLFIWLLLEGRKSAVRAVLT